MMRQTMAIFHDSYRELNSRKLFWISFSLSTLLVLLFGATGLNSKGVSFLIWTLPIEANLSWISPEVFYKWIFLNIGVKFWLTWGAMILALVSTASIIPEFVASGSIELSLSRPISRVRLFLTKYIASLLFAGLQVAAFSIACFLVIGIRGDAWEPRVFLAIPIVLLVFSYLYCISALVGLFTRSTIFSLMAACLFWFVLFALNVADTGTLAFKKQTETRIVNLEKSLPRMETWAKNTIKTQLESGADPATLPKYSDAAKQGNPTAADLELANPILLKRHTDLADLKEANTLASRWNTGLYIAKALLPKTAETTTLLDRSLLSDEDVKNLRVGDDTLPPVEEPTDSIADIPQDRKARHELGQEAAAKTEDELRSRSLWYVIGGSLVFEFVILAFATWRFTRRDF